MDVRCSRCGTEYDFDDALVSERGTTVKCTNCGHQFKVYPGGGSGVPERWIVRKSSGRELVYTSLRDLQRAIAQKQVGPTDLLSRGGGHPLRALGAIAELEPFFQAQGPTPGAAQAEAVQRTLLGMSPTSGAPPAEDTVPDASPWEEATKQRSSGATATPPIAGSVRRSAPPAPPRPPVAEPVMYPRSDEVEPKTVPRNIAPEVLVPTEPPARAVLGSTLSSSFQNNPVASPLPINDGMNAAFRGYQDSFSDESIPNAVVPRPSAALRWIVGLVMVGGLAFVGGTVGVKYVKKMSAPPAPSVAPVDDRVVARLEQGNADLSRGDFESAKEEFDKASALAEGNPAVLSALARLEASRADIDWLSLKLIDPSQKAEADAAHAELDQRLVRVRKAADAAAVVAPNDASVIRVRIDALRLDGNVARARELVGSLGADSSDPDTAYVLAALDLAEPSPAWPTIIDRMRTAASAERGVGRARAALVYALATSGAGDDAKAELSKLEAAGPSVLVGRLHAYVARLQGAPTPSASAASSAPAAASVAAPAPASPGTPSAPGAAGGDVTPHGDFRKMLENASAARKNGDLATAEALYRGAEAQSPGNVEALAGLGDVARLRGDTTAASGYYDQVLDVNPTYLPALIASADIKWASGNHAGALPLYKRVVNQSDPSSPYGARAAARIAESQGGGTTAPATGAGGAPAAPSAAPPAPSPPPTEHPAPTTDTPAVDTTDLPGYK